MSALEEEIVSLVQDKYLMTNLGASVSKWNVESFTKAYQRLLSVYDSCFDFTSSTSCVKARLIHVQKCLRLLGIGHLAPRLDELTDSGRALRIISAIDDKISAKHSVQVAAKRNRVIMKQEELRNKPVKKVLKAPPRTENPEQENVDPNIISTNLEEIAVKPSICLPSSGVAMTQNEWLVQQKANARPAEAVKEEKVTTIIPTGRQLPRTPVKPSDVPPEETDSPGTPSDAGTTSEIESNEENSFLSHAPASTAANLIPSGRQLPRTPKAEGDLNVSDDQPECKKTESLLQEKPHHSKDLATQKNGDANRRGTFVLPTPPRCQQTTPLSEDFQSDSERRGTFTFPPPAGYEKEDSYNDDSEDAGDKRGTFTLPPPLGNEKEEDTLLDRRGTYTFSPPAEFQGEDTYCEEGDEEDRSTFSLPPPVGYEVEDSHNDDMEVDADRRGTFTLPPPRGYGEDDTYTEVSVSDRRGTFNVSSAEVEEGDSHDSCLDDDEDNDTLQNETNRRETFVIPLHSKKGERRDTYAINDPSDVKDRRGTYAISGPSDDDRRGTYAISGPSDDDRRGTYAISGPSDDDRRGTYAISGPSDDDRRGTYAISGTSDGDRRGTYNLGKGPSVSEDYVGPVCSSKMKNEILVFRQDSPKVKAMGPIPDLSEFDDLPFTDELPASEVAVNNCTFQLESGDSSKEVSELSERDLDTPLKSHDEKNASLDEKPLPVSIVLEDCGVPVEPPTAKENYIPRGKQIPRTPNESDIRDKSNSLVNSSVSVTESTYEHSSIGSDPDFSVQIFVATPKRPQNTKLMGSKGKDDTVLIDVPREDDTDVTRSQIQKISEVYNEVSSGAESTPKVKQNSKQGLDVDTNSTSEEYAVTNSVDLQNQILEDKSPNHLSNSLCLKENTNVSGFNDSLDIFPTKKSKKLSSSVANGVTKGESIDENMADADSAKRNDSENKSEFQGCSKEEKVQRKYAAHKEEEISEDTTMHNPPRKRTQVKANKEKTTEKRENVEGDLTHTDKKGKNRARETKLRKKEAISEDIDKKMEITKEEGRDATSGRDADLKLKVNKSKETKTQRSAKTFEEDIEEKGHLDADLASTSNTEHNDSDQLFLHPVKTKKKGRKGAQEDNQIMIAMEKKEEDNPVKEEHDEPKEKRSRQRKPAEDTTMKRRGRRRENAVTEDSSDKVESTEAESEKREKQDSAVESSKEMQTSSRSEEVSAVKALPRRGRRKKVETEEILLIPEDEEEVKLAKLSPKEEPPKTSAPKRGRPSRKAAKDLLPKENDVKLNETITVQKKGKKKLENAEEKMNSKKRNGAGNDTSRDKQVAEEITEPVQTKANETLQPESKARTKRQTRQNSDETVPSIDKQAAEGITKPVQAKANETLQPESKARTKRQTRKNIDEMVIKSPPAVSVPAKKSTRPKRMQAENIDPIVENSNFEESLIVEAKKSTRRKKTQVENVALVEEKVEEPEKAETTVIRGESDRESKKRLEGVVESEENTQTQKTKGRRKKASPDDSNKDVKQQVQEIKEKETQKNPVKAPRGSKKKKQSAETSPAVSPQDVLPATGRLGRRCKVKASAAIAETLNSSDSDFLKTIRAYQ
ncbi:uncharacterized protein LOC122267892 isoform X2 [Penaeus japonicus]|uniref:uncharacterized protein LOC122267892 isoform X2 n=1 Tax=Penaeus japonicus TaxID=27405 RepID=UPI001C70CA98|nr:uncharacterized protein LOC122267892 isoform X2 [Penaeus japonicus]